jgi:hypothetical protein
MINRMLKRAIAALAIVYVSREIRAWAKKK